MDDWQLLNDYAMRNSEDAFRTLVERHAAMVYQTALRQLGNHHTAEEITQAVFIVLARKAARIRRGSSLAGWLFRAARFAIANQIRGEIRRRQREQDAFLMDANSQPNEVDSISDRVAPILNEALGSLSRSDRDALLIRFFQNKSYREVAHLLSVTEAAAKVRVYRALERLRLVFARQGYAIPRESLLTVLAASNVNVAPAGLSAIVTAAALGKASSGSSVSMASGILKLMTWSKVKAASAVAAGVVLVAAVTGSVVVNSGSTPTDGIVAKLEHQSGRRIVCDKHISIPPGFAIKDMSFEEALDQLAVEAGAYWTVDYAIYSSDQGLRRLVGVLQDGDGLQTVGWTNLSSRQLEPRMQVIRYRGSGGLMLGTNTPPNVVGMIIVLNREASQKQEENAREWIMKNRAALQNQELPPGGPNAQLRAAIRKAMDDGIADGVLAPERLLAESELVARMNLAAARNPTPETAKQIAEAAHARWTTIYTLRKSPLEGGGFKLIHAGRRTIYGTTTAWNMPMGGHGSFLQELQKEQTTLTPEERAAHERAVQLQKQNGASTQ